MDKTNTGNSRGLKIAVLIVLLCAAVLLLAASPWECSFHYRHDPRMNPTAMRDIVVNPRAVYGFSPSPDGTLAEYISYAWTDPEAVAGYRQERLNYFASYQALYDVLDAMTAQGADTEAVARAVSEKRNEIRLAVYDGDPDGLATLKARNLATYGHENGPTPDELYEKYGSWETVIEKAFSHNCGVDACLGLYDDYYNYYVDFGYVKG